MDLAKQLGDVAGLAREAGESDLARALEELATEAADIQRVAAQKDREIAELQMALRIDRDIAPRVSRSVLARRCPQWQGLLRRIAWLTSR